MINTISNIITENMSKETKYIGYGIGNSHKEGAQNAAKMALIIYCVLNEDQYNQQDIFYPSWDLNKNEIDIEDNLSD